MRLSNESSNFSKRPDAKRDRGIRPAITTLA
jgi:hypothetical protein